MKDLSALYTRLGLIGATFLIALACIWPPRDKLKLGIDLSGGTILVYQVEKDAGKTVSIDELIGSLKQRINPEGLRDIPIRAVGSDRIEIILPQALPQEVDDIKRMLTNVGSLEFRILANRKHDGSAIERALGPNGLTKPPARYGWAKLGERITGTSPTAERDGLTITDPNQFWTRNQYAGRTEAVLVGTDASGRERTISIPIVENTASSFKLKAPHGLRTVKSYTIDYNPSEIVDTGDNESSVVREEPVGPGRVSRWLLYKEDRQNVTGNLLSRAYRTQDERLQPAVGFVFNRVGARKFGQLTRDNLPEEGGRFRYRLAILLDGTVMSAPAINSEIRESGIIEGGGQGFRPEEVAYLINILQSGSLPASLNPTPLLEETIGATLGDDTINKGVRAIMVSMLIVPLFMIVYYRFAGVVAVLALILNMTLLLASMAISGSSFTLPGLAGLALTIGMAVDANVLIFERMREEKERGAGMAQQVRNGFDRAWVTIFDANITTILSGLVLFAVGTEEVKGFAVTLIIGLLWNLFTAVFVSRVIFDFWLAKGWLRKTTMMQVLGKTNIDFIGPRKACMTVSVILIAIGLAAVAVRGPNILNIDFTGGTLVTLRLNDQARDVQGLSETQRAAYVRSKASAVLPDVTVESLNLEATDFTGGTMVGGLARERRGLRFNVRTTEPDVNSVMTKISGEFKDSLARLDLKVGEPTPIPTASAVPVPSPAPTSPPPDAKKDEAKAKEKAAWNPPSLDRLAGVLALTGVMQIPTTPEAPRPTDRFAGGLAYPLTLNSPQPPSRVVEAFRRILTDAKLNPDSFEIVNPSPAARSLPDAPTTSMTLPTNLDKDVADAQLKKLVAMLHDEPSFLFERRESFGAVVAGEMQGQAIIATVASWIIIAAYLWFRFKSITYGLAAIIAVVHDVLITLGAVALTYWLAQLPGLSQLFRIEQLKIDLPMVAAFLTLIGFSVNDTIVIFDRIRELKGKTPYLTSKMINDAVNQTLSRTILTSLTAWLVVVILYFFGGEGLHGFAFCLVVGFISGTYSTIYIASPILINWANKPQTKTDTAVAATARR